MISVSNFKQTILGYSSGGVPIWSMIGAEGETGGQSAIEPQTGNNDPGQSAGSGNDPSGQSATDTVSRVDFDRQSAQLRAADQKRQEAEDRAKALEDEKKDELTRATDRSKELEQSVQALNSELQRARIENAFLKDTNYRWQDPSDALRFLADDDSVTIDDSGRVTGMEAAIKNLATKKPYLVKSDEPKTPDSPSGDPSNGGNKNQKDLDTEALKKKYPTLARN